MTSPTKQCEAMPVAKHAGILLTLCLAAQLLGAASAQANNLTISNVSLTNQDTTNDFILVQFNISWDNSWRISGIDPNNYDAVWVFVKYRVVGGPWMHATINLTGHTLGTGSASAIDTPSDGKGVFIRRTDNGTGTVTLMSVQLRWNYGVDGLPDNAQVEVQVIGIEMVYVPQGAFAAGSGGTESNAFTLTTINTAVATVVPTGSSGSLGGAEGGHPTDETPPDNASWPNGFAAFYIQKYEISQEQYTAFLNLLTYDQQATRTESAPNSAAGIPALSASNRNGIEIQTPGVASTTPAVYANDFTDDGVYDQNDDGQDIACNFLKWEDGAAYADWAGLRPMTELEYEKASRGTFLPVADEYAWGNTSIHATIYTITNDGGANATVDAGSSTGNASYTTTNGLIDGPLRVGIFAASFGTPARQEAGATFYGVMEMSGNLWERPVTIDNTTGRAFTGTHGDGVLTSSGEADVSTWPPGAIGTGLRGGAWDFGSSGLRVSDRILAATALLPRTNDGGFRAVRSAQ